MRKLHGQTTLKYYWIWSVVYIVQIFLHAWNIFPVERHYITNTWKVGERHLYYDSKVDTQQRSSPEALCENISAIVDRAVYSKSKYNIQYNLLPSHTTPIRKC